MKDVVHTNSMKTAFSLHASGDRGKAEAICMKTLEHEPRNADASLLLGIIQFQQGDLSRAEQLLQTAAQHNPLNAAVFCNLGLVYAGMKEFNKALTQYHHALKLFPRYPAVLNNMGNVYREMGQFDEAIEAYNKSLAIDNNSIETNYNLGVIYHESGNLHEADRLYKKVLKMVPDSPDLLNNIGLVEKDSGRHDEAIPYFEQALRVAEGYVQAHINLAITYRETGRPTDSIRHYAQAMRLVDSASVQIKAAMVMPVIMESRAHIAEWRTGLEQKVDALLSADLRLSDPFREIGATNFYLAYHGQDNLKLQTSIAALYEKACPSLLYTAPHCLNTRNDHSRRKIRIGFVSRFLRDHTIGKYVQGIITHLDHEKFEIYIYSLSEAGDTISNALKSRADGWKKLFPHLDMARKIIADDTLDILFYPEIGMDPFTYFLAFSRLAPVQCTFYGHPDTTGLKNIDYFISHEDYETEEGKSFYSERLLLISRTNAPTCYLRPPKPEQGLTATAFGFDNRTHIYLCPQSLFKIHPDMDAIFRTILEKDTRGVLAVFGGSYHYWTELFLRRLEQASIPFDRVKVLPPMSHPRFLSLMLSAHVILDTAHFSGGNTTFDAFSVGAPIVTMPGRFLRGRQTYALYRRMGINDCIVNNSDDYVNLALRLTDDTDFRNRMSETILARNSILFEDTEAVREIETYLLNAYRNTAG